MEEVGGLLEAVSLDEPHRVERAAVGIGSQAVDRDDAGMLQPAGDLGLDQEPLAADGVVGVLVEDLLERHLAVELGIQGHKNGAQAALGVGPQHAKPLARGGGRPERVAGRAVGVGFGVGVCRGRSRDARSRPRCRHRPTRPVSRKWTGRRGRRPGSSPRRRRAGRDGRRESFEQGSVRRVQCPGAIKCSARDRDLSQVQAWNAATSSACWIKPVCKASKPKRRWRSAAMGTLRSISVAGRRLNVPSGPADDRKNVSILICRSGR